MRTIRFCESPVRGSLLVVALTALCATASADAWSEQGSFTQLHSFGGGGALVGARDVAVSSSLLGQSAQVFVADPGAKKLVRFSLSHPDDASPTSTQMEPAGGWGFGPNGTAATGAVSYATGTPVLPGAPSLSVFISSTYLFQFYGESGSPFIDPRGVDVDEDGNVYVVDNAYGRVQKFTAKALALGSMNANAPAQITFELPGAEDVSVDIYGRVHVVSGSNVTVFNRTGGIFGQYSTSSQGYVDAKDLGGNSWFSQTLGTLKRLAWDSAGNPAVDVQAFSSSASTAVFGMEFQEFESDYHSGFRYTGSGCTQTYYSTDCIERLYVATNSRILVYGVNLASEGQSDDAVARWRFDEPETECPVDLLCDANVAFPRPLAGPVQERVKGVARYARQFNGSLQNHAARSWFEVADDPSLNFGTGDLTIECWIKTEHQFGVILDKRWSFFPPHFGPRGYSMFISAGRLSFKLLAHHGSSEVTSPNQVVDGKWHHVAVSVDRNGVQPHFMNLYVDGELEHSIPNPTSGIVDNMGALNIGRVDPDACPTSWTPCHIPSTPNGFDGALDELAFYKRALSEVDIKNIYIAGRGTKQGPKTPPPPH